VADSLGRRLRGVPEAGQALPLVADRPGIEIESEDDSSRVRAALPEHPREARECRAKGLDFSQCFELVVHLGLEQVGLTGLEKIAALERKILAAEIVTPDAGHHQVRIECLDSSEEGGQQGFQAGERGTGDGDVPQSAVLPVAGLSRPLQGAPVPRKGPVVGSRQTAGSGVEMGHEQGGPAPRGSVATPQLFHPDAVRIGAPRERKGVGGLAAAQSEDFERFRHLHSEKRRGAPRWEVVLARFSG